MLLTNPVLARDLTPSLDLAYNTTNLSAPYDTLNLFQNYNSQSIIASVRVPLCESLDLNIGGGPSILTYDTWSRSFIPSVWVLNSNTGLITPYGSSPATGRRETLRGYNFSVDIRWYL